MGIRSQNNTNPLAAYLDVFSSTGTDAVTPGVTPASGLIATGGVVSDYTDGPAVYRAHIFRSSGTFGVTALSENIDNGDVVEYLLVGGGGGGGNGFGGGHGGNGGGGAGGYVEGTAFPVSVNNYTITIGGGGQSTTIGGLTTGPSRTGSNG